MTVVDGNSIFEGTSFFYVCVVRFHQEKTRPVQCGKAYATLVWNMHISLSDLGHTEACLQLHPKSTHPICGDSDGISRGAETSDPCE